MALLPPTNATFKSGIPNQFQISGVGPTIAALSNLCNTLPSWITFTDNLNNSATVSGTPPSGAGDVNLFVLATPAGVPPDYICSGSPHNYTIHVDNTPYLTSANTATFTAGTSGAFVATGVNGNQVSLVGALPQGLTFTPIAGEGLMIGTPVAGTGGIYPLTFTISDGSQSTNQHFTLVVNEAATIVSPNTVNFVQNTPSTFPLNIYGYPHTPSSGNPGMLVSVLSGSLPPGMTLSETTVNGHATGQWVVSGTPSAVGLYSAHLDAHNGVGSSNGQQLTINVIQAGDLNADGKVDCSDVAIVKAAYGTHIDHVGFNSLADVNSDGVVDLKDLAYVSKRICRLRLLSRCQ